MNGWCILKILCMVGWSLHWPILECQWAWFPFSHWEHVSAPSKQRLTFCCRYARENSWQRARSFTRDARLLYWKPRSTISLRASGKPLHVRWERLVSLAINTSRRDNLNKLAKRRHVRCPSPGAPCMARLRRHLAGQKVSGGETPSGDGVPPHLHLSFSRRRRHKRKET